AKVLVGLINKGVHAKAATAPVDECFIASHQETAHVIGRGPGELWLAIKRVLIMEAGLGAGAPGGERGTEGGPKRRIVGSGDNVGFGIKLERVACLINNGAERRSQGGEGRQREKTPARNGADA